MKFYFFDTSALIKRYILEAGSAWVREVTNPHALNPLLVARITWVEAFSALGRLQREGKATVTDVASVLQDFYEDWDSQYQVVELDWTLAQMAGRLVQKYPSRAYDSVQLAAALKLQAAFRRFTNLQLIFVSADQRLLAIAQMESLLVENPNHYP